MLTSLLLAAIAALGIAAVIGVLMLGVLTVVYGPSGALSALRAYARGRFRSDRRPWWDFFGFTDESDVVYPLQKHGSDGPSEDTL